MCVIYEWQQDNLTRVLMKLFVRDRLIEVVERVFLERNRKGFLAKFIFSDFTKLNLLNFWFICTVFVLHSYDLDTFRDV